MLLWGCCGGAVISFTFMLLCYVVLLCSVVVFIILLCWRRRKEEIEQDGGVNKAKSPPPPHPELSGPRRSTRIASDLASRPLALQAKPQPEPESQAFHIARSWETCRFCASQANIARFLRALLWHFSCEFRMTCQRGVFASLVKKKLLRITSDLGVCDSNRIAHRCGIPRFGPLSPWTKWKICRTEMVNTCCVGICLRSWCLCFCYCCCLHSFFCSCCCCSCLLLLCLLHVVLALHHSIVFFSVWGVVLLVF